MLKSSRRQDHLVILALLSLELAFSLRLSCTRRQLWSCELCLRSSVSRFLKQFLRFLHCLGFLAIQSGLVLLSFVMDHPCVASLQRLRALHQVYVLSQTCSLSQANRRVVPGSRVACLLIRTFAALRGSQVLTKLIFLRWDLYCSVHEPFYVKVKFIFRTLLFLFYLWAALFGWQRSQLLFLIVP